MAGAQKDSGLLETGNIDLQHRPVVKNKDGSISTVKSMSFEDEDGKEVLVPTVSPEGRMLTEDQAVDLYHKTGQHLGKFSNSDAATKYAESLHNDQAKLYENATPTAYAEGVKPIPGKQAVASPNELAQHH